MNIVMEMKNFEYLVNELRKLGLNKKESLVYMTLLEMGPSTVQQLAPQVGLSRPTMYRILEGLQKKDLVSREEKRGERNRSFFVAGSPDHFLRVLRVKQRKAEEQEREFLRIISVLQTKYYLSSDKNEIKISSKKISLDDLSNSTTEEILVIFGSGKTIVSRKDLDKIYTKVRNRMGKLSVKEVHQKKPAKNGIDYVDHKIIDSLPKGFGSNFLVIADSVYLFDEESVSRIENEKYVEFLKFMFSAVWELK